MRVALVNTKRTIRYALSKKIQLYAEVASYETLSSIRTYRAIGIGNGRWRADLDSSYSSTDIRSKHGAAAYGRYRHGAGFSIRQSQPLVAAQA